MSYFTPIRRDAWDSGNRGSDRGSDHSSEGLDQITRDCIALRGTIADELIEREINTAIAESRWDDAIHWQRVRLRVKRVRARGSA